MPAPLRAGLAHAGTHSSGSGALASAASGSSGAPRGERKMREVQAAREARIDALVADWSPSERSQFASLLARFNDALLAPRD